MKLAVQVKTKDNMAEVKKWITESFSKIDNIGRFGWRDFSKLSKSGSESTTCGTMPFDGTYNEIIFSDSENEGNLMTVFWNFPQNKFDFQSKQSLTLILSLFAN